MKYKLENLIVGKFHKLRIVKCKPYYNLPQKFSIISEEMHWVAATFKRDWIPKHRNCLIEKIFNPKDMIQGNQTVGIYQLY